jgi:prophage regulatory protein
VRKKKMSIKNKNPNDETLPSLSDAPPLRPDEGHPSSAEPRKMLSEKQVLAIIPVSRATLFRMEKRGAFPRGTYISANRRIWFADEVVSWQNSVNEYNPNRGRGKGRRPRVPP